MAHGIDGLELLKEGADVMSTRIITDEDLKRIRIMKLKQAVKKVDRKGFRDSDDNGSESNGDEEGEEELSEKDDKVKEQPKVKKTGKITKEELLR